MFTEGTDFVSQLAKAKVRQRMEQAWRLVSMGVVAQMVLLQGHMRSSVTTALLA